MNLIKFQRRYSFSFVTYEDFIYKDACETTFMLNDKDATAAFCLLPAHQATQLFQLLFLLFILSALLLSDPPTTIKVTQHAILNKCLKIGNQVFLLDPYNPLILLLPASTTVSFSQGKDSEETVFIFTFAIKRAKEKRYFSIQNFQFSSLFCISIFKKSSEKLTYKHQNVNKVPREARKYLKLSTRATATKTLIKLYSCTISKDFHFPRISFSISFFQNTMAQKSRCHFK